MIPHKCYDWAYKFINDLQKMLSFRVFPSKASKYDWWDDNQTVGLHNLS